ncbi:MAG TPA: hypothetical protein VFE25_07325 [Opitutaceae bacterium]|nr:hypothetical protein [Opitutaceae bacterium]
MTELIGVEAEPIHLANDLAAGDGWALISKYGDHPHPKGPIQRFEKEDAEKIVAQFKSVWGRIKRAVVGLTIYDGHPDAEGYANIFPDKTPYGTFADLEARDDGMFGRPILTTAGGRLVEDGKDRLSPFWSTMQVGKNDAGKPIVRPFKLKSVGLVTRGNIPGPSLMNSSHNENTDPKMKEYLLKLLLALGVTPKADASDADLANSVDAAVAANTTLATSHATLTTKVATLEGEKVELANAKATAATELETFRGQVAAERKERAILLVNSAVIEGRLAASDRDSWVTELCNSFDTKSVELSKLTKRLKTTSATGDLANKAGEAADRQAQVMDLVNARMDEKDEDYETAFTAVQKDPKNAGLFKAMKQPEAKA